MPDTKPKQQDDSKDQSTQPKVKKNTTPTIHISISTPVLSSLSKVSKANQRDKQMKRAIRLLRDKPTYQELIRDVIRADISIIEKRNFLLCPHRHHCVQNAFMKGYWRTFAAAFIFKTSLSFCTSVLSGHLFNFRKRTFSWENLKNIYLSRDSLLFANIFALMSFTYKVLLCCMRRYRRKDPVWHKTLAGFICGFWILLDTRKRRNTMALYCVVRAVSDLVRLSVSYGKVPAVPHFDVASFSAATGIIMYAAVKKPGSLDPKYYKWIKGISELQEHKIQAVLRSPGTAAMNRLPHEKFVECCPTWHPDSSCLRWSITSWFKSVLTCSKMYLPVHFLPSVLLSPKKVMLKPVEYVQSKGWNTVVSSVFLATYIMNMRYTICFTRNLIRDDPGWVFALGGFTAGLSLFIENAKRRSELALYCIPRALEWMVRSVDKEQLPELYKMLRSDILPTIVFQVAAAIWLSIWNMPRGIKHSNSINMTVLKIVFGSKH